MDFEEAGVHLDDFYQIERIDELFQPPETLDPDTEESDSDEAGCDRSMRVDEMQPGDDDAK